MKIFSIFLISITVFFRPFFIFAQTNPTDTSSIPDTAPITSATISLYVEGKSDALSQSVLPVQLGSAPASHTALANSDFNISGWNTAALATSKSIASITTNAYNTYTLNSTGLEQINKAGVSKFGWMTTADQSNTPPTWSASQDAHITTSFAETSGTSQDPKLVVVYASNQAPTAPTALQTESQTNPPDISDPTPEFSAIYNDPNTGDLAPYYRMQVSTSSLGNWAHAYWDSGTSTMATTTEGSRSPELSYGGSPLASSTVYYWRIKFSDDDRKTGDWSTATSTFSLNQTETGGTAPNDCACATTTINYIHTDHLSGSNAITNDNVQTVQVLDYYPYGSLRVNRQESDFNEKRKFTGYEHGKALLTPLPLP